MPNIIPASLTLYKKYEYDRLTKKNFQTYNNKKDNA